MKKYKLKKDFPSSEIGDVWVKAEDNVMSPEGKGNIKMHESLFKPFNDWFEDYKEPKVGYIIDPMEEDCVSADDSGYEVAEVERAKELGIWFETEEEAVKAVEKLKARKRLENKGLKFGDFECDFKEGKGTLYFEIDKFEFNYDDFDLLFGGEE